VVSSDREIASYAVRRGKATLSSSEFESIVNNQSSTSADSQFPAQKIRTMKKTPVLSVRKDRPTNFLARKDRLRLKSKSFRANCNLKINYLHFNFFSPDKLLIMPFIILITLKKIVKIIVDNE